MDIRNLKIDAKRTVGENLMLVEVLPVYVYEGGKRTDKVSGYRYVVAMPEHAFDKIAVKIDGKQRLELPDGDYPIVDFDGLELSIYWSPEGYRVGASAMDISVV